VFDGDRYFDVTVEFAKASPDDILMRVTVENRGPDAATLWLLPQVWLGNTWSWGRTGEGYWPKGTLAAAGERAVTVRHPGLMPMRLTLGNGPDGKPPQLLFTENETDFARIFGSANSSPYVKDAFHEYVVRGRSEAVNPAQTGSKAAGLYRLRVGPRGLAEIELRLCAETEIGGDPFDADFGRTIEDRRAEADAFYDGKWTRAMTPEERRVARQAYAGLLWNKQFYHYVVREWLEGDPAQPPAPAGRQKGRNRDWQLLSARDVLSMPDNWEYPWFAAWDLAFHMIPFAEIDPDYAKEQLVLLLREWYMHPNGAIPAYEWAFSDVNPPVHAWAAWRVYKMTGPRGKRDRLFLERVFQKLLLNFTWWVNRKDEEGDNVFGGGFLGLDNIGPFDR